MAQAQENVEMFDLALEDGRQLTYCLFGAPLEPAPRLAVLYHHGNPSCALEAEALHEEACRLGVAIIAMDRSGIGSSSFNRRISLASVVDDTRQLADHLDVAQFAVVGCSGGGPYATACAALLPDRVLGLVLVCALGALDGPRRHLLRDMTAADRVQLGCARWGVGISWACNRALSYMAKKHLQTLIKYVPEGMAKVDGELMAANAHVQEAFGTCLLHAYVNGAKGMAADAKVLAKPWGLDLTSVKCKVHVWQGEEDITVPPSHARWYHSNLEDSELHLIKGEGHITLLLQQGPAILESVLSASGGKLAVGKPVAGGDEPAGTEVVSAAPSDM